MTPTESPTVALARVVQPLDQGRAATVRQAFGAMFDRVEEWQSEAANLTVTAEDQVGKMKRARLLRLEIQKSRVALDKRRKELKSGILVEGRAIDGAYAIFEAISNPLERHLLEQEQFAERAEQGRRDALRSARESALLATGMMRPALPAALGEMSEEAWDVVIADASAAQEARAEAARVVEQARIEASRIQAERDAERRAEAVRAEAQRQAREDEQRAENERLRIEAAKREEEIAAERRRVADAHRIEREARERAELQVEQLRAKAVDVAPVAIQTRLAGRLIASEAEIENLRSKVAPASKHDVLVAALREIAALDDDEPDEPNSARRARRALVEAGELASAPAPKLTSIFDEEPEDA